jgi:hypothetical protein
LADQFTKQLNLDLHETIEKVWQYGAPKTKLTTLLQEHVLPNTQERIVFALDEADKLLTQEYAHDFFALLRSWHNDRSSHEATQAELWNKLNLVLVISTEPYLLIQDVELSPFNVAHPIYLDDFSEAQVRKLNERHRLPPVKDTEIPQVMSLLNGHPYLTRLAFYELAIDQEMSWSELRDNSTVEQSPFISHLRHYHRLLDKNLELKEALQEIIALNRCTNDKAFFYLLQAGLVKGSADNCLCRCELYHRYFEERLR